MLLGIDHLVIAVDDLDAAAEQLEEAVGLRATEGGRHDALGTLNRLVWLGDSYIELIAVADRTRAGTSWIGRPTLATLDRGGGFATFAIASDDIRADVARLRASGSRLAEPLAGERRRPDGRLVRWLLSAAPELGPTLPPFLIEHDPAGAEWSPEERAERAAQAHPIGGPVRLVGIDIPVAAAASISIAYLRDLGLRFRPSLVGGGTRETTIGGHSVRLRPVPPSAPDRHQVVVRLSGGGRPATADVLGCRWIVG